MDPVFRWRHFTPEVILWRVRWYCKYGISYRKVRGKWKYLFRAIDQEGHALDFYLPATRNAKAAKRFLAKALKRSKHTRPGKINTDKNPT